MVTSDISRNPPPTSCVWPWTVVERSIKVITNFKHVLVVGVCRPGRQIKWTEKSLKVKERSVWEDKCVSRKNISSYTDSINRSLANSTIKPLKARSNAFFWRSEKRLNGIPACISLRSLIHRCPEEDYLWRILCTNYPSSWVEHSTHSWHTNNMTEHPKHF